nr:MFS transporter [Nocardia ignorata]
MLGASTLGVMAGAIVMPVLEVMRGDLGVSGTAAGFIITAHGFAIAVISPVVGRAIDRWGVRVPLAAGLVLYGLAGGAGLVITSFPLLIASRLLLGVGAATVFSGTTVAMLAMATGTRRDRLMGWRTTATTAGGLIWPLLAGVLGGISWHATFAIYLVGIPLGIAALLVIPKHPATQEAGAAARSGSALDLVRRYPRLLAWYGLMVTTGLMMYSLAVFLPQRLAQLGIAAPIFVSLFMVVQAVASIGVGLGYARIRARFGFAVLLRTTACCWIGAFIVLGLVTHPAPVFAASALFGDRQRAAAAGDHRAHRRNTTGDAARPGDLVVRHGDVHRPVRIPAGVRAADGRHLHHHRIPTRRRDRGHHSRRALPHPDRRSHRETRL